MNTIPPDEHLRQALRHAPDADVAAPQAISAQILAAAQRSAEQRPPATTPAPRSWLRGLAVWWRRPSATAAFASVLMAGLVGLLWRDGGPGPANESPGQSIAEPASRLAARPAPSLSSHPAASPLQEPATVARLEPRATATPTAVGATAEGAEESAKPRQPVTAPRRAKGSSDEAAGVQRHPQPQPQPQPATIAPAEPDRKAQAESTAGGEATPGPVPAGPTASTGAAAPAVALGATAAPPSAITATQAAAARRATAREVAAPLSPAAADAAADAGPGLPWPGVPAAGDEWRWPAGGEHRPPDGVWWSSLALATQGRWKPSADAVPAAGAARLDWVRAGTPVGSLWFEPTTVLWCGAATPCQRAPLSALRRRELLEQLAR